MPSSFTLNVVTGGLFPDVYGKQTSLVSGGIYSVIQPQLGPFDSSPARNEIQNAAIAASIGITSATPSDGSLIITAGGRSIAVGTPGILGVNTLTALTQGLGTPQTNVHLFNPSSLTVKKLINNTTTFTGSDLHIIVDMVNAVTTSKQKSNLKQLLECTTFTVSIHREKAAVRAAGYINPKGFARGRRTIAGTLVLTQFTVDVLYEWLMSGQVLGHDVSKDTFYTKIDQLPPFNMTMLFVDEYGNISYRRVLGVELVTDGVVYSSNDMLAEQTISYMAADFTPLLNIEDNAQYFSQVPPSAALQSEKTPGSLMTGNQNPTGPEYYL